METVEVGTTRKLAKLSKCAHEECTCTVTSGEQFCSDYCASQAGADDAGKAAAGKDDCGCGHTECTAASAAAESGMLPIIGTA
jgi:hypothetical protein